jgi:hypothetical protein
VFRAKFRDALKAADPELFAQVPPSIWKTTWSVHYKAVGDGRSALKYLTPSIYRVALSNRRLVSIKDGNVTFSYKPHDKGWQTMTLPALTFIGRFLQHVLPKGFQNVRYFGFLHPSAQQRFNALKEQLGEHAADTIDTPDSDQAPESRHTDPNRHTPDAPGRCPHCGGSLRYLGRVPRCSASGPPEQHQRGPP